MKNFVLPASNIPITAPYARLSGEAVQVGTNLYGVCQGDVANGAAVDIVTEGVFDLAKVGTDVVAIGAKIYWDNTAKLHTITASTNLYVGVAIAAAGSGAATARVRLNGSY